MNIEDGEMHASQILRPRWLAVLLYCVYFFVGAMFTFFPSEGLRDFLGETGSLMWNLVILMGGSFAIYGASSKKQLFELIGLPGVGLGFFIYGALLIVSAPYSDSPGVFAGLGGVFLGTVVASAGRWVEVYRVVKINLRVGRKYHA